MLRIIETEEVLEIQDRMSLPKRRSFFLFSLLPLLTPYQLLLHPDRMDYLSDHLLLTIVLSMGSLMLSGFLLMVAGVGINSLLYLNKPENSFTCLTIVSCFLIRKHECELSSVVSCEVDWREAGDGSLHPELRFELRSGRTFTLGSAWTRSEIEEVRDRMTMFLELG